MSEGTSIPAGVAQPQDHLPPQESKPKPVVERTDTGFRVSHRGVAFAIEADALNDFELLRDLAKWQDPAQSDSVKVSLIPAIFERFFGPAQGEILNALREPGSGRVRMQDASSFLFEVFQAIDPES